VTALILLGVVLLVQQVEGHILQPLLLGRAVKVHPLASCSASPPARCWPDHRRAARGADRGGDRHRVRLPVHGRDRGGPGRAADEQTPGDTAPAG
jgi:hypothetical protein